MQPPPMIPQPPKKQVIAQEEWEAVTASIQLKKADLNNIVMNYLVIEGYKDAAEKFAEEAQMNIQIDLKTIEKRMNIRNAIQNGMVEEAVEMVNDLDPEILDTNPQLFFHLQQQRLIEYIRNGEIQTALDFAQEELAPRGMEHPEFLASLESTMSLLAFPGDLLLPTQRAKTASQLNSAILLAQSQEKDPKLPSLLKALIWAQATLEEKGYVYPKINNLETGLLEITKPEEKKRKTSERVNPVDMTIAF